MSVAMDLLHLAPARAGRLLLRYRRAGWSVIDQAFVSAANFLSILILARAMPPAAFGAFMLAHTGLLLATSLQTSLVTQAHNMLGAGREGAAYVRFTTGLALVQLAGSAALGATLALIGALIWRWHSVAAGALVMVLAAALIPWMAQEFFRRVLFTRSEARAAAVNDLVSYGLQLAGVAALAYASGAGGPSPEQALLVFGGSSLAAAGLGLWQVRAHLARPASGRWFASLTRTGAEAWEFGKWLLAQQAMNWFGGSGHGWLLAAIVGTEKFGMYRAAYQIVNVLNPLRQAGMNYLPARAGRAFALEGVAGLDRWVRRTTPALAVPFGLGAVAIALFAGPLLSAAYGDKFAGAGLEWVVVLGATAYLIGFSRTAKEYGVLTLGGAKALFLRTIVSTTLVLAAGVPLMFLYGIRGAVISEAAIALVVWSLTQKIYVDQQRVQRAIESETTRRR